MNIKKLAIIPCAGYGTRVDMPINQSKELLSFDGEVLLKWHLDLCKEHGVIPLVITRKEKQDLINYCAEQQVMCLILTPKGEWIDTVLASKHLWGEKNILLLPDTRYEPREAFKSLLEALDTKDVVVGTHEVSDGNKWGIVNRVCESVLIAEKPKNATNAIAWGLIAFCKTEGIDLLKSLRDSGNAQFSNAEIIPLKSFKDYTR